MTKFSNLESFANRLENAADFNGDTRNQNVDTKKKHDDKYRNNKQKLMKGNNC